ncbi:hypothetical protein EDB80DRAFT_768824 [Ilyonectria destructans]|nr:hypothetical protein EDB80DRAFT_768824 [Ilyonectria destructans]
MRLEIVLEVDADAHPFRPRDRARGELRIWGHTFKQSPHITATLRDGVHSLGRLNVYSNVKTGGNSAYTGSTCNGSDHVVYTFTFPSSNSCCPCQLPPSLETTSSQLKIKVEYVIIVAVRYQALCRITRVKTLRRELSFESEPSITFLPTSNIGSLSASKLFPNLYMALEDGAVSMVRYREWLPLYTPALQLEVLLPSPPILTPGRPTPIQLILHTPPELLDGENIYIRSVEAQLRSCIKAKVGQITQSVTETQHGWNVQALFYVNKEHFELDLGAWGQYLVLNALSTCTSCVLDLTHSLRIAAGISIGGSDETQLVETSLDVIVIGAPPSYTADTSI